MAGTKCVGHFYFMEVQYANRQDGRSELTAFSTSLSSNLLDSDAYELNASQVDDNYTTWLVNSFVAVILNEVHTMDMRSKKSFC